MGRGKGDYDVVLRCRAPQAIKRRLERLLDRRGHGDLSELIRGALVRYLEAEESRLGIPGHLPFYASLHEPPSLVVREEPPAEEKGGRVPNQGKDEG